MNHMLYLMFRYDFDVIENLDFVGWFWDLNTPCISTHFYIITAFYIIIFALVFGEIYEQIVFGLENMPEYCGRTTWIIPAQVHKPSP